MENGLGVWLTEFGFIYGLQRESDKKVSYDDCRPDEPVYTPCLFPCIRKECEFLTQFVDDLNNALIENWG